MVEALRADGEPSRGGDPDHSFYRGDRRIELLRATRALLRRAAVAYSEEVLRPGLADRYVVDREIGRGGMASVLLAHEVRHDRQVAIRVIDPDVAAVIGADRFRREIQITAQLTHPGILPVPAEFWWRRGSETIGLTSRHPRPLGSEAAGAVMRDARGANPMTGDRG
jgi:hypothetical protein